MRARLRIDCSCIARNGSNGFGRRATARSAASSRTARSTRSATTSCSRA
ncbi:hypothetical protein BURPSS13_C0092 [Burkholderia pseudomallei S13]|nr:hypothetical protein BURPSS13_C0092 [Burkholderia pseudomallei S13]